MITLTARSQTGQICVSHSLPMHYSPLLSQWRQRPCDRWDKILGPAACVCLNPRQKRADAYLVDIKRCFVMHKLHTDTLSCTRIEKMPDAAS